MRTSSNAPTSPQPEHAARELITRHGGRVTRTRVAVVTALQDSAQPLSHEELGTALAAIDIPHDRVTLYRALDWLVEQGIARRIAGSDRAWRFEMVRPHSHRHAHFHCDRCGQVICLEGLQPSPSVNLPDGFQLDRAELVLHGACATCGLQSLAPETTDED
ncbi:MAG: transcriptional repressor [Azoarcus sp.]|jgi:Fur family ferric uptake transcriptional regulator|nr:MAG: transcriptional repressor [Betaproteobacteria bacterium HGW-Betaproteobacteria-19]PLX73161.1 MAG: transcriptional repressor [Azoarcus sp.]TVT53955.1 MAG: transcriptional repressor [Azoarcus sp. PHD]